MEKIGALSSAESKSLSLRHKEEGRSLFCLLSIEKGETLPLLYKEKGVCLLSLKKRQTLFFAERKSLSLTYREERHSLFCLLSIEKGETLSLLCREHESLSFPLRRETLSPVQRVRVSLFAIEKRNTLFCVLSIEKRETLSPLQRKGGVSLHSIEKTGALSSVEERLPSL